jgi:hypothetical protein
MFCLCVETRSTYFGVATEPQKVGFPCAWPYTTAPISHAARLEYADTSYMAQQLYCFVVFNSWGSWVVISLESKHKLTHSWCAHLMHKLGASAADMYNAQDLIQQTPLQISHNSHILV